MKSNQLDEIDEKILRMLVEDGRIPFQEVARACGVSGTTIHARVKRLASIGVIQGAGYIINPSKIGYETCAYIGLNLMYNASMDAVVTALSNIPEVVEIHYTNESYDLFVKVYARNNDDLLTLIQNELKPLGLSHSKIILSFREIYSKQLTVFTQKGM